LCRVTSGNRFARAQKNDKAGYYNKTNKHTQLQNTPAALCEHTRPGTTHGGARLSSPASFAKKMRLAIAVR
jgi:hypothetical protein